MRAFVSDNWGMFVYTALSSLLHDLQMSFPLYCSKSCVFVQKMQVG